MIAHTWPGRPLGGAHGRSSARRRNAAHRRALAGQLRAQEPAVRVLEVPAYRTMGAPRSWKAIGRPPCSPSLARRQYPRACLDNANTHLSESVVRLVPALRHQRSTSAKHRKSGSLNPWPPGGKALKSHTSRSIHPGIMAPKSAIRVRKPIARSDPAPTQGGIGSRRPQTRQRGWTTGNITVRELTPTCTSGPSLTDGTLVILWNG